MPLDFFHLLKKIGLMGMIKVVIFRFQMLVRLQGFLLLTLFPMALPSFFLLGRSLGINHKTASELSLWQTQGFFFFYLFLLFFLFLFFILFFLYSFFLFSFFFFFFFSFFFLSFFFFSFFSFFFFFIFYFLFFLFSKIYNSRFARVSL